MLVAVVLGHLVPWWLHLSRRIVINLQLSWVSRLPVPAPQPQRSQNIVLLDHNIVPSTNEDNVDVIISIILFRFLI